MVLARTIEGIVVAVSTRKGDDISVAVLAREVRVFLEDGDIWVAVGPQEITGGCYSEDI